MVNSKAKYRRKGVKISHVKPLHVRYEDPKIKRARLEEKEDLAEEQKTPLIPTNYLSCFIRKSQEEDRGNAKEVDDELHIQRVWRETETQLLTQQ
ncbi:hypothetical protein RUM44_006078 [Polyplax serrata]|uniref:Uncharacterized protein n=1 Tax=Polyplax serrata TaxID=468196 RepID=A0ABR1AYZ7_POLSC